MKLQQFTLSMALFTATCAASSAQAAVLGITGSGSLTTVGDQISGGINFDTGIVGYTLTLDNNPQSLSVDFNTANAGDISFVGGVPTIGDTWSATFDFASPVDIDIHHVASWLNGSSSFAFAWNTTDAAAILDPSDQLINELAGPGSASFAINPNPGAGGSTSSGGSVFGPSAFLVDSPLASQLTLTWTAVNNLNVATERLDFRFDTATASSAPVPTPGSIALMLLGIGAISHFRKGFQMPTHWRHS